MAYTDIDKPDLYFNTKLYTGNGSTQSITGVGFQPDFTWIKVRSTTYNHRAYDVVRGVDGNYGKLFPNLTNAENTIQTNEVTSLDSDGFTLGNSVNVNNNGSTFASWNWLANNTSGSSNTDGTITSTVSANTTSGFSIVSYTGNGSAGATVGHGLGVAPSMLIFKNRDTTDSWNVQHDGLTSYDYYVRLNSTGAQNNDINVGSTAPTSTVVTVGSHAQQNGSSNAMILYAFAEKKGFSKFGSYTGNGNDDGTFVYTGFKPAFFITKSATSLEHWYMNDSKRSLNGADKKLFPNLSSAESSQVNSDILSNGFKLRFNNAIHNSSGQTYIYMAFAENPFTTSTGIPTTAR